MADTVETRTSWTVAFAALAIIMVTFGAPYVVIVALKPIAADLGGERSAPALASSLAYLGTATGGVLMGWVADRIGVFWTVLLGTIMVGCGAMVAGTGSLWALYAGYGVMIGLLGNAGIFAPLLAYVSRWFDRRRGVALSIVTAGQQVAGAVWPTLLGLAIGAWGWQRTLVGYGIMTLVLTVPLALLMRRPAPAAIAGAGRPDPVADAPVLGLRPNVVFAILCAAIVGCCVPMSMPMGHLVAFCSDLGFAPARGAEMLSLLLASAFVSRLFWGFLSDRMGGLRTVLLGTSCQAIGMALFLVIDDMTGLYLLSAAFGLGFGGIVPSYMLALRELYPAAQAGWRISVLVFFGLGGMALGGWVAGLIYDRFAAYQPAFTLGLVFNLVTISLVGALVLRDRRPALPRGIPVPAG